MENTPKVSELPLDIVYEILLQLPVKSLCRFRCVSKPMCSLIDTPKFQKQHYDLLARHWPLLLVAKIDHDGTHARFSTYSNEGPFLKEFSKIIPKNPESHSTHSEKITFGPILHCRGFICFSLMFDGSFHVCNPSTEQIIMLPKQNEAVEHCFGFGYAASIAQFKVIRFYQDEDDCEMVYCEIFTLGGTGGWRKVEEPPYCPNYDETPLLDGALHLLPRDYDPNGDNYIAVFDVDTEIYREIILFPEYFSDYKIDYNDSNTPFQLAELRGSLCLAFELVRKETLEHRLELWILKDYRGVEWVRKHIIDLSSVVSSIESYCWTIPLAVTGDGRSILLNVCFDKEDELHCYNTQDSCFEKKIGVNCWAVSYIENHF